MPHIRVVLAEVREMGPLSAHEVAVNLGISDDIARRRLRQLEEQGLIESDNHQRGARVWMAREEGDADG